MSIYFHSVAPDVNVKHDWMETGLWFGFEVKIISKNCTFFKGKATLLFLWTGHRKVMFCGKIRTVLGSEQPGSHKGSLTVLELTSLVQESFNNPKDLTV